MSMNICIVIPLYNEAFRFNIDEFVAFVKSNDVHFYMVNDGSTDATEHILNKLEQEHELVTAINLPKNVGKGEAIRTGITTAITTDNFTHVGYFDADLATPLDEIPYFKELLLNNSKTFVMGSRIKRLGATITRYTYRHFAGRVVATIISEAILKLPVYDTQCGAKLIESNLAKQLFKDPFKTKWLFDVELLSRMKTIYGKAYCLEHIYELPLANWIDKGNSKLKFADFLKTPFQLAKLYLNR